MRRAFAHDLRQVAIERVLGVGAIEPLITVAAADHQIRTFEFRQFILNRAQREKAEPRQLTRIQFLAGVREEQSQHLCAHDREQSVEQRLIHTSLSISNALCIQVRLYTSHTYRCRHVYFLPIFIHSPEKTAGLLDPKLDLHLTYQGQERGVEGRLQLTNNLTYA